MDVILLHKMVNQTHQVKSWLPTVKWSSRIGCQGDEENYPGRVRQQDEDSPQVRASGGDADVPKHKSTKTKTEYNIGSTEERAGKTEDRREDQDKNRLIRGRRGKAKDRQSRSTEERTKIDTLKKEKTL